MKKYLLTTIFAVCLSLTTVAQEKTAEKTAEEKEAGKAKKEADLLEVFKIAQITPEEQVKMREFIKESGEYGKELRADPDFTEEEKVMKAKLYARIKNARIRELLGDEKYKVYRDAVNAQKAKAKEAKAATVKK
ncbi:MAG: hypothetical protein V4572_12860 [Bacteroidota bacterium]